MRRSVLYSAISSVAAILILAAGCADQNPTMVEPAELSFSKTSDHTAVKLVDAESAAGSYSAVIDPAGGTLAFGNGAITFPKGAVAEPTMITATVKGQHLAVQFGPHGLTFPVEAQPELSFKITPSAAGSSGLQIVYLGAGNRVLERLRTNTDKAAGQVSASVAHFSVYAVAKD